MQYIFTQYTCQCFYQIFDERKVSSILFEITFFSCLRITKWQLMRCKYTFWSKKMYLICKYTTGKRGNYTQFNICNAMPVNLGRNSVHNICRTYCTAHLKLHIVKLFRNLKCNQVVSKCFISIFYAKQKGRQTDIMTEC